MGSKKSKMDKFEVVSGLYMMFVFIFIIFTAYIGDHSIFLVLIGFLPTILTIIISLLMHEQVKHHKHLLWIVPILVIGGFFALKDNVLFLDMDMDVLTGVNFILALLYVVFAFAIFGEEEEKVNVQAIEHIIPIPHKEEKKSLKEYINSIEDKSKALNFVIGRVYSQSHGGNKSMREKIQISSELYNEFSLIGISEGQIDKVKLLDLINTIELKLKLLEKTEKDVFETACNALKNLIRDVHGKDKIIDVLDHNDKDPVRSYYEGALEFCERVKEELDKEEMVSIVKNEYIPKSEEDAESIKTEIVKEGNEVKKSKKDEISDEKEHSIHKQPIFKNHP
ncbi:MAG: hypothetical protein AB7V77_03500 [Candidatus Woesearchaeota archaeon]